MIEDKDKEYYLKGIDTAQQIVDLMEGREGDYTELEDELKAPEYESLVGKLSDSERISASLNEFNRPEARAEAVRFRKQISRRANSGRITRISVAAAVAALAIGTWYFMGWGGKHEITIARVVNDVMLTMPDGSEIVLDQSIDNSRIAEHGNIALTLQNGTLSYEKQSSSAQASEKPSLGTVEVPRGTQFDLILEDGTRVWMNANSRLRFPVEFSQEERRVYLEGEAYFEVFSDAKRPFLVETKEQTLKVLGTEFNVYAYSDSPFVATTLVHGSVSVMANHGGASTILKPGQQARLSADTDDYTVADVDTATVAAWRNGTFIFNDNTLGMVFDKLSRWYDFEYVFEDPHTADIVVMGNIPTYFDFNTVLSLLNDSKIADISTKGSVVTIKANKKK